MYVDRELTLQSHVLPYTMCLHSNKYDLSSHEAVGGSIQTTDVLHFRVLRSWCSEPLNGSQVDAKGVTIYGLEINLHSVYTKTSLCKTLKLV